MTTFKKTRKFLVESYFDNIIDDEEFVLLYDSNFSKNPAFPYQEYGRFCLEKLENTECEAELRFRKNDIPELAEALGIPEYFKCPQGTKADGLEGLCAVLKRFAYPCRYSDMIPLFGRAVPELSMITNVVVDYIYDHHGHRVSHWNEMLFSPDNLKDYASSIFLKGAALNNCVGFIDGTVRAICRPGKLQRAVYNGHKRVHAIKFQSVALPNGMIGHLYGPMEGRRHDSFMLAQSGLLNQLQTFCFTEEGQPLCLYGDPAYPLRVHLQAPFRNAVLTQPMKEFNKSMSKVRIAVEWLFGDIVNYFKFMDFKKNLKIGLSCVGKMYIVCAILRNALTCLYGNQTSEYFGLSPPTLQEYFGNY
ncbi:uncharacterized protein LOC114533765 [Dendronephthya gigantea]|uniref:uncharacterized protein LOC114533765 n=3 Tax=Dendronephthya gigantea TaxID=151771 RepID=UPI00106A2674|nr:uncharacterized protein LOC114533765 [Dendronephthya gigantea]